MYVELRRRSLEVPVAGSEITVNSLVSDHPWCKIKWLLTGGGCLWEKSTNKPNAGLIDQLQKDVTLSAKIRQGETNLLDFFFTCKHFQKGPIHVSVLVNVSLAAIFKSSVIEI